MGGERDEERELVLHRLHVRRPPEGTPREPVRVHAVLYGTSALALGVDRVRDHVGEVRAPLAYARKDDRVAAVALAGCDLAPLIGPEPGPGDAVRDGTHRPG